jgi:hypothetical protein
VKFFFKSKELPAGTIVRRADGRYQKVGKEWKKLPDEHIRIHKFPIVDPEQDVLALVQTSKRWASFDSERRKAAITETLEDVHSLFHHDGDTKKFWKEWSKTFDTRPSDDHKRIVETVVKKMMESAQKPAPEHVTESGGVPEEPRGVPEAKPVVSHGGEQHVVHTPVEPRGVAEYTEPPKEETKLPITEEPEPIKTIKVKAKIKRVRNTGKVKSPSQFITLKQLQSIMQDHYIGASGQEYTEGEVDHRIMELQAKQGENEKDPLIDQWRGMVEDANSQYKDKSKIKEVSYADFRNAIKKFGVVHGFPIYNDPKTEEIRTASKKEGGEIIGYIKNGKCFIHEELLQEPRGISEYPEGDNGEKNAY